MTTAELDAIRAQYDHLHNALVKRADHFDHWGRPLIDRVPEMLDHIAQEIQSTFSSKLTGRDAHQVAEIGSRARYQMVQNWLGLNLVQQQQQGQTQQQQIEKLAQRFERAASKKQGSPSYIAQENGESEEQQSQQSGRGKSSS